MFDRKKFTFADIPDLSGKVAIVTGANKGIGFITARELARKNAHVFVGSRSKQNGQTAVDEIKKETGNDKVELLHLNLASLKEVKEAADNFQSRNLPLHILVNNAGIMGVPFELTVDGIETIFATNHVGPFLFTKLLLPIIEASAPSRIVNVSSDAHIDAPVNLQNVNLESEGFWMRYKHSKTANILFTVELAKRLEGKQVFVNTLHPGIVNTSIFQGLTVSLGNWAKPLISLFMPMVTISPDNGALNQLYAATSPEIEEKNYRAQYFVPYAKLGKPGLSTTNPENAERLWNFTEELIAKKFEN